MLARKIGRPRERAARTLGSLDKGWCRHEQGLNDSKIMLSTKLRLFTDHRAAASIRDGIAGRTSTSVGFATTNYGLACSGVMSWGRQLRRSAMSDAVALVWTATILAYAVIAVAFILGRWAFNRIRQVLEHEGALQRAKTKSSACR
jgi:hypothetical protein